MLILLLACAEPPTSPEWNRVDPAFAKPGSCPGHPSCGTGEDPAPDGATVSLTGGYKTSTDQSTAVRETGKVLELTADQLELSWSLPLLSTLEDGLCISHGFGSEAEALSFWNGVANDFRTVSFRTQVDKKSLDGESSSHFMQATYAVTNEYGDGNVMRVKTGNHEAFGAATYSRSGNAYTLTGGAVQMDVLGGAGNGEIASVKCSTAALGTWFRFAS